MNKVSRQFGAHAGPWIICIASTAAACALFWATGTYAAVDSLLVVASVILTLVGLHVVYTCFRPDPVIGPIAGGLAIVTWAATVAGMTALAALRSHAPLIDASLAYADAVLGLDAPALVAWVAFHSPIGELLDVAYLSTVPLLFATVAFLALTRREDLMWELCFAFAGSATVCALASAFVPAIGMFAHYRIAPGIILRLPTGAGLFHLPTFEAYRSGALDMVDVRKLEGVVSFPSFHAAMALTIAFAFRDSPKLFGPAVCWSSLILVSTVPIGGHFFVDVLAGSVVWAALIQPFPTKTVSLA